MAIKNLLYETINVLEEFGHSLNDIVAFTDGEFAITKEQFIILADNTYDSGFGTAEVANDLILIGNSFWLERGEYDGSEWWKYKTFPNIENLKYIDNPIKIIDKYGGSFGELTGAIPGSKDDR